MNTIKTIDLYKLIFHEKNRHIDAEKVLELVASIRITGLLQNPVVRSNGDGTYTILSGHHRVSAFRILAKEDSKYLQISCIVQTSVDSELILIDSNIHSPLSPYEMMMALGRKEEIFKEKIEKGELGRGGALRDIIAAYSPMLKSTQIGKYLRIYKRAIEEVKQALKNNEITLESAASIAMLSASDQLQKLKFGVQSKSKDIFLCELQNRMQSKLSTKVKLESNKISISYMDQEDLNRIIEIIGFLEE